MKVVTINKNTLIIIIPNKVDQFKSGNSNKTIQIIQYIKKHNIVAGNWMISWSKEIFLGTQPNICVKVIMICLTKLLLDSLLTAEGKFYNQEIKVILTIYPKMSKPILFKDVCQIYLELIFKMVDLKDQILQEN